MHIYIIAIYTILIYIIYIIYIYIIAPRTFKYGILELGGSNQKFRGLTCCVTSLALKHDGAVGVEVHPKNDKYQVTRLHLLACFDKSCPDPRSRVQGLIS